MSDETWKAAANENRAWKITEENTSLLSHISGRAEIIMKANLGWYLVEDWSNPFHRFFILPEHNFHYHYPNLTPENEA